MALCLYAYFILETTERISTKFGISGLRWKLRGELETDDKKTEKT